MKNNKWKNVTEYFNSKYGQQVTLIDIEVDLNHISKSVLGCYKTLLTTLGYIKIISKGNKYKVIKKVPIDMNYMDALEKSGYKIK